MLPLGTGLVTLEETVKYKRFVFVVDTNPMINNCNCQFIFFLLTHLMKFQIQAESMKQHCQEKY